MERSRHQIRNTVIGYRNNNEINNVRKIVSTTPSAHNGGRISNRCVASIMRYLLIRKSCQKRGEEDKRRQGTDWNELHYQIEAHLERICGIFTAQGLHTKLLYDMMSVLDGNPEHACHRNDDRKVHIQYDQEDDIVPSIDCRPIPLP